MEAKKSRGAMMVSAPGKIILFGEHSVVYEKRALAFSLGLRTELTLRDAKDCVCLHLPEIDVEEKWSLDSLKQLWEKLRRNKKQRTKEPQAMTSEEGDMLKIFLGMKEDEAGRRELGLMAFLHLYMTILPYPHPFSITVKSQMPISAGLGSSAAYAVCLAGVLQWLAGDLNPSDLNIKRQGKQNACLSTVCEWALCCEKILHGKPSGIDNAICTYGGAVSFKAGKADQLSPPPLRILLVNTCVKRNTKTQVARVNCKFTRIESVIEPILTSMDNIAESALSALKEIKTNSLRNDILKVKLHHLQELVDINHCLLSAIGVSHPALDRVVAIAKSHDLHAKLTGAGGGGFAVVLLSPDISQGVIDACIKDFDKEGFTTEITCLGGEGLTMTQL